MYELQADAYNKKNDQAMHDTEIASQNINPEELKAKVRKL